MIQEEAFNLLKLGCNVFLTGAAGAGKTYLLNRYIRHLFAHDVRVAITASTGIAATHIGGHTIHSWCGIGIRETMSEEELDALAGKKQTMRRLQKTKVLIIDEISMLHGYQFDFVDRILRKIQDPFLPFGGVQLVTCGDFFQLPPVSRESRETQFAFETSAWTNAQFRICYLHEQHRQNNDPLLSVLNDIRSGRAGEQTKVPLRTRYKKDPVIPGSQAIKPTILYARNINVDAINSCELAKIDSESHTFSMTSSGFPLYVETLKKHCLAPEELVLKVGVQVMFVKNAPDGLYVNGTRGQVCGFDPHSGLPIVTTRRGRITVKPEKWEFEEYGVPRASITQVPLRLAWAITIHKSQGMTLDAVEVDLSDAFEPGMGYVALSRARSLNGLKLLGLNEMALKVSPKILEHDQKFLASSEDSRNELRHITQDILERRQQEVLHKRFDGTKVAHTGRPPKAKKQKLAKKPTTYELTRELIEKNLSTVEIAKERSLTRGTILDHIEKLKAKGRLSDLSQIRKEISKQDFDRIMREFKASEDGRLGPVFEKLNGEFDYDTLRLVRMFVDEMRKNDSG